MKRAFDRRRELVVGDLDVQLLAHGPEGDGSMLPYGAESQGIIFPTGWDLPAPSRADEPDELLE